MGSDETSSLAGIWIIAGGRAPDETEKALTSAALRVWPRAQAYARRALVQTSVADDSSVISSAWEDTLRSVLNSLRRKLRLELINDLDSYLFGAFVRRLRKIKKRERVVEFVPTNEGLVELRNAQDWDWADNLENALDWKRAVNLMDDWTKQVCFRRAFGDSWKRIAKDLGMTEHQAKMRFRDRLKKIRQRLAENEKTEL